MEQKERKRRGLAGTTLCRILAAGLGFLFGCSDAQRVVVVNGLSSAMSVVDLGLPPSVTDHFGGNTLGPSANRVVVRGSEAFVVNSGTFGSAENASIQVIDLTSGALLRTIPLPDGDNPWAVDFVNDFKAYVTNWLSDSVTVINPTLSGPGAVLGRIQLPETSAPEGIVVYGGRAYTANTGLDLSTFVYGPGTVSVIDTTTDTLVDADGDSSNGEDTPVFLSGVNPQDLEVDAAGDLWVVCTGDWWSVFGSVDIVDLGSLATEATIPIGGSPGTIAIGKEIALLGDGAAAQLFAVNLASRTVLNGASNPIPLSATPWSFVPDIVFDRQGEVAYALSFLDDRVFEMVYVNGRIKQRSQYALEGGSGPAGLALAY